MVYFLFKKHTFILLIDYVMFYLTSVISITNQVNFLYTFQYIYIYIYIEMCSTIIAFQPYCNLLVVQEYEYNPKTTGVREN